LLWLIAINTPDAWPGRPAGSFGQELQRVPKRLLGLPMDVKPTPEIGAERVRGLLALPEA
jgi:hypothetical protein